MASKDKTIKTIQHTGARQRSARPIQECNKQFQKYNKQLRAICIALILLFVLLALYRINAPINYDESMHVMSIRDGAFFNYYNFNVGPMLMYLLFPTKFLIGMEPWALRMVPLVFGLLSIFMVYTICRRFIRRSDHGAHFNNIPLYAVILLVTSAGMFINSLSVYTDGSILLFFMLCSTYFFLLAEEEETKHNTTKEYNAPGVKNRMDCGNRVYRVAPVNRVYRMNPVNCMNRANCMTNSTFLWLALSGVFIALAAFTKYSAIILIPTMLLYYLFTKKPLTSVLKNIFIIFVSAILVFSIYPISTYLYSPSYYEGVTKVSLKHSFEVGAGLLCKINLIDCEEETGTLEKAAPIHYAYAILRTALLTSPLLLLIAALSISYFMLNNQNQNSKNQNSQNQDSQIQDKMYNNTMLFVLLLVAIYFFYMLFLVSPLLDTMRYLQFSVGFLAILAAPYVDILNPRVKKTVLIFGLLFFIIFSALSINNAAINFTSSSADEIASRISRLDLLFYLPIHLGTVFNPALFYTGWVVAAAGIAVAASIILLAWAFASKISPTLRSNLKKRSLKTSSVKISYAKINKGDNKCDFSLTIPSTAPLNSLMLITLMIISFGAHLYLFSETAASTTTPDVIKTKIETIKYSTSTDTVLAEPIFTNDEPLGYALDYSYFYLDPIADKILMNGRLTFPSGAGPGTGYYYLPNNFESEKSIADFKSKLRKAKTVIFIDEHLTKDKQKGLNILSENCSLKKKFITKARTTGYIFDCSNQQ